MNFEPVKRVLRDLKEKIAFRIETMGHPCSPISPELGSRINFSEIEQARCWMFATDHYLPLMMKKPRERRIPPLFLDPDSAFKWYDEWFKQAHDLKIRFNIIPCPNKGIILLEYLHELAQQNIRNNVCHGLIELEEITESIVNRLFQVLLLLSLLQFEERKIEHTH